MGLKKGIRGVEAMVRLNTRLVRTHKGGAEKVEQNAVQSIGMGRGIRRRLSRLG